MRLLPGFALVACLLQGCASAPATPPQVDNTFFRDDLKRRPS